MALAVEFQRLNNGVLDLLRGRPRWEKLGDSIFGYFELLHLVGLFLLHNGNECVFGQPFPSSLGFGHLAHFDGLGVGRGAVHLVHDSEQVGLFFFSQVRQLHRRAHGNLESFLVFENRVIYQFQNFRDKVGKADKAKHLISALTTLSSKLCC